MRRAQHGIQISYGWQRNGTRYRGAGALGRIDDLGRRLIEDPVIVGLQANTNAFSYAGHDYSIISLTVPAPTVRPPSRMAKRRPLSMAMGVISSTSSCALSPGITISVPAGNCATPVTSVVRK